MEDEEFDVFAVVDEEWRIISNNMLDYYYVPTSSPKSLN
jgi:hypothetical protein